MKHIFNTVAVSLAALLAAGCDNAEYGEGGKIGDSLGVHAFFAEGIKTPGISSSNILLSQDEGAKATLTPSLTDKLNEDCVMKLVMDQDILARYNAEQGTSFEMLPDSLVNLGGDITIPAGQYAAEAVIIELGMMPEDLIGLPFAVPVKIEKVSGDFELAANTSGYVIEVSSVLENDLAQFNGAAALWVENFEQTFDQFTIEMRLQVSNTNNRNRDIFSCIEDGELMFRFEDPQSASATDPGHSLVQFQGVGGYLNPKEGMHIEVNKWQHYAVTYDGTKVTIYVNGVDAGSKEFAPSVVKNGYFKYLTFMGIGGYNGSWGPGDSWWYGCKTMVTECRIWSVARTADQIAKNMASVTPTTKGLEGYWRVNKATYDESKSQFEDLTGKGHPMTAKKGVSVWNEGIQSIDEATPWK